MRQRQPGDLDRTRKRKGKPKLQPGILLSWEAFNEEAMREWLDAEVDAMVEDMDMLEASLRGSN
jgi:hypothetical protein